MAKTKKETKKVYITWETDGHYIQGKKVGAPTANVKTALNRAKKVSNYDKLIPEKGKGSVCFWIEDANGRPIGLVEAIEETP